MIVTKLNKSDKDMLRTEFEKVWHKRNGSIDEKMVKHCISDTSAYMTINDLIVTISKPKIQTNFCFGYHANVSWSDYDEASDAAECALTDQDYFIYENLDRTDADAIISNILNEYSWFEPWLDPHHYYTQTDDCKLAEIRWESRDRSEWAKSQGWRRLTDDELKDYYTLAYEEQVKFLKRLKTYLKRYGMSKVNTWTYWLDE